MEEKILFKAKTRNFLVKIIPIMFFVISYVSVIIAYMPTFEDFITRKKYFIEFYLYDIIGLLILFGVLTLILTIICYVINSIICYKIIVTDNKIKCQKGSKKFDILFNDIIVIIQKGKSIIIKTHNKKIKLSSLKECNNIYNYIKPFVPEITIKQNDVKNILD